MRMYLLSMGEYQFTPAVQQSVSLIEEPSGDSTLLADEGGLTPEQKRANLTLRKHMANEELNQIGGLTAVGQLLQMKLAQLDNVDRKKYKGNSELELQLRMLLNILANMVFYNNDDPSLSGEFTSPSLIQVERICLQAVQISLELAIVPIRKFLIIFYIYLRMLFGNKVIPGPGLDYEPKKDFANLQYLKSLIERFGNDKSAPRHQIKTDHAVEKFYKRHMTSEMLIP